MNSQSEHHLDSNVLRTRTHSAVKLGNLGKINILFENVGRMMKNVMVLTH